VGRLSSLMGKKYIYLVIGISFLLFFSSCHKGKLNQTGGVLRIGDIFTPTEINPLTTDSTISANLLELIFDTLVRISPQGKIEPELSKRWEISSDQLTWTFHLRHDVHFHDGSPLTAHDVQFTYETLRKSKRIGQANPLTYIKEIHVKDPYTLQIMLSKPDNALWGGLGVLGIVPKALLENDPEFKKFNRHPIGSGPYRFVKQNDQEIVLEANENYFGGRPHLDRIVVKILPSQTACLSHLIAGKIDMIFLLNPEDYGALSQILSIKIHEIWQPMFYMIFFNTRHPLFRSSKVRQALNWGVNKEILVRRVLNGKGFVARGSLVPGAAEWDQSDSRFAHQPRKALELLKEEGWEDRNGDFVLEDRKGRKFELTLFAIGGDEVSLKISRLIQQQLQEMGIKVNVSIHPLNEYVRHIYRERDFEAALVSYVFISFYDNNFTFWHSSQIESGLNSSYSNPEADRLLEEERFALDPERRKKALHEFQRILHEDPPALFLLWRELPIALHSRFRGVPEGRVETLRFLTQVWEAKEERKN